MDGLTPMSDPDRAMEVALAATELVLAGWPEAAAVRAAARLDRHRLALETACARHASRRRRRRPQGLPILVIGFLGGLALACLTTSRGPGPC